MINRAVREVYVSDPVSNPLRAAHALPLKSSSDARIRSLVRLSK